MGIPASQTLICHMAKAFTTDPAWATAAVNRKTSRPARLLLAGLASFALLSGGAAKATDPNRHCNFHDLLLEDLRGPPHFERRVLILRDKMPDQGHRFALFMNKGERGRHSYTLLRTRRGKKTTCIVSAGLIGETSVDEDGHKNVELIDENDPETFTLTTRDNSYEIIRSFEEEWISDIMLEWFGTRTPVVSYGRIMEDHRESGRRER